MTETIKLMKAHTSVRRFKEQEIPQVDLNEILTAAQMASSDGIILEEFPILLCDCGTKSREERCLV